MTDTRTKTRLFVDADLVTGGQFDLMEDQARYLGSVLRMGVGDLVSIFNGRDGEWQGRLEALKKGRGTVSVEERLREQTDEPGPWLVFAPLKKTQTDFVAEKATELGVSRLCPVMTEHTASARVNADRLMAHAREAAEQCGRLTVPGVDDVISLMDRLGRWPEGRSLLVMDETGGGAPIAEAVQGLRAGEAAVLIGPEGGFSASELDALSRLPFVVRVGLGPRILRAETAAVAALSCLQMIAGDGAARPPERTSR